MNIKHITTIAVGVAALNLTVTPQASAETIANVTVSTNMGQATTFNIQNSVNGSGFSEDAPKLKAKAADAKAAPDAMQKHFPSDLNNAWFSNPDLSTGIIEFNLNEVYELTGLDYWNASGEVALNGIKGVTITTSIDGVQFTPLEGSPAQFAQGTLSKEAQLPQSFSWKSVRAQYIRFQVNSNYMGKPGSASGFSEIRFQTSSVPAIVAGDGMAAGNIAIPSGLATAVGLLGSLFGKSSPPATPGIIPSSSPTASPTPSPSPSTSPTPNPKPSTGVPTPALLPGLMGIGITLLRKRHKEGSAQDK